MSDILIKMKLETRFHGIVDLDGDGSASNIVKCMKYLWRKDGLNPEETCWFASDHATTFTSISSCFKNHEFYLL